MKTLINITIGGYRRSSLPAHLRDNLLNATLKDFSLSTRLAHAARLGFFFTKMRYKNSLLLLLLYHVSTTR